MIKKISVVSFMMVSSIYANGLNTQMQQYMERLKIEAKKQNPDFKGFDYSRGEKIFVTEHIGKRGKMVSCVTCHTDNLSNKGLNANTNKVIKPLSPLVNSQRFTKVKDVKKWLRRNFRDVYNRVGTAQEKGDVITYITNKN